MFWTRKLSDYETQIASKRYQKSLKIDLWGVREALGGGLGIPLPPWAAQNRKRGAKPGSWLTPGRTILMIFRGRKVTKFHVF